jgi:hypothetical protein
MSALGQSGLDGHEHERPLSAINRRSDSSPSSLQQGLYRNVDRDQSAINARCGAGAREVCFVSE